MGGLWGTGVSGPRYKSSATKNLPHLTTKWWPGLFFAPLFSGHFRPIFEPRCPRVPCYPPVDRSPHFGLTLRPLQNWVWTGLRSQEWDYALILVSVIFQPPQIIWPKICSRKSGLKSASLAPLANPLHQARRNRSQIHQTRFPLILITGFNCILSPSS